MQIDLSLFHLDDFSFFRNMKQSSWISWMPRKFQKPMTRLLMSLMWLNIWDEVFCDFIHYKCQDNHRNQDKTFSNVPSVVVEDEDWVFVQSKEKILHYYTKTNWCTWRNMRTFWYEQYIILESSLVHVRDKNWKLLCNCWEWYSEFYNDTM